MLTLKKINNSAEFPADFTRRDMINFLYEHLGEFGDTKEAIGYAIDYAFSSSDGKGGFLVAAYYEGKVVGALVMNHTGMSKYIPAHILVYVAVNGSYRGQGFGRQIVQYAIDQCAGNVALHVEYDNPAKRLYERMGFTSKYAEMRYMK